MPYRKLISLIASLFVLVVVSACGDEKISQASEKLSGTDSTLTSEQIALLNEQLNMFPNNTQASIALIRNGETIFFGVARRNDTLVFQDNRRSVFEIGSITKVFTSTLLANYVLKGELSLADDINQYIPVALKDSIRIAFGSLANHTSGLPRMPSNFGVSALLNRDNPYKNYDDQKLEAYLSEELSLAYKPGTKTAYSNVGVGLLGYVLVKFVGKDYHTQLRELIFSRYAMSMSTTNVGDVSADLVKGLDGDGDETSNWTLSSLVGAGGILSNVEDLSKFAIAQFDSTNQELRLTQQTTYADSAGSEVGLGWHIIHDKSGGKWHWHNGGTGGYSSSMALDIRKRNGVIILTNVSAFNDHARNVDKLCLGLMRTLSGDTNQISEN